VTESVLERVARDPHGQQALAQMTDDECAKLLFDWEFLARPEQLEPSGDWDIWLLLTGRGWGKSRTGAEWIRKHVELGNMSRIALIARTAADVRDVMIEGESGLMAISPSWFYPTWEPSKRRLTWPNGAMATTYSADEPNNLRGPQHDGGWCDELAAWRYADSWDNFLLGLRLGQKPRAIVTTTPRPTKVIKQLAKDSGTYVTRGSTYDNIRNVAPSFKKTIMRRYEGTTLGRQELYGEVLTDVPGALWNQTLVDDTRIPNAEGLVLERIVVAIDPAVTANEDSDETGIVVVGLDSMRHAYVLDDLSGTYHPIDWAKTAVRAYEQRQADRIVAETNNGGEMVELTLRTVSDKVSYKGVHASRGKVTRAEPVAALYEQGKVHHVGTFPELEDQMCSWLPGMPSPDRIDALVWAITELLIGPGEAFEWL
jgi:phage terminase large subunit-like protein